MKISKKLLSVFFTAILFNTYYPSNAYSNDEVKFKALPYFNAIHSFKAKFAQTSPTSNTVQYGTVLMKKPGLLKWDYYPPTSISIIMQKATISYYDKQLEEHSYSTINNSIIDILSTDIKYIENIEFFNIRTNSNQKIITIKHTKTDTQADIIFNINPILITGINISTPDSITYIQFYDIQNNIIIEDNEFKHTY